MQNKVLSLAEYKCDEVTRDALQGVVLPPATKSYQPIGHFWLLALVLSALEKCGFVVGDEHHGLSHDGARYFGLLELRSESESNGYSMLMGIRNSLDKTFAAQLAFGNRVLVCANLSFFGQYMLGRKHTTFIMRDIPDMVIQTMQKVPQLQKIQEERFELYRNRTISPTEADHIIMDMYRTGAISTSRIGKVVDEWDNPSFDHGGDRTVWRMFNAATQAMKGLNVQSLPHNTMRLQSVCDEAVGFMREAA